MKKACPELRNCENKNIKALLDRHHIWDRVLEPDVLGTPLNIIAVESVLTHTDWRSWRQAALTAVCRLFGIKFTTARAQYVVQLAVVLLSYRDQVGDEGQVGEHHPGVMVGHSCPGLDRNHPEAIPVGYRLAWMEYKGSRETDWHAGDRHHSSREVHRDLGRTASRQALTLLVSLLESLRSSLHGQRIHNDPRSSS